MVTGGDHRLLGKNFSYKEKYFPFTPKINTKSFISTSKTQLKIAELLTFPLIPQNTLNTSFYEKVKNT
jgi:hypothetical protein